MARATRSCKVTVARSLRLATLLALIAFTVFPLGAWQARRNVSGVVLDRDGQPLSGSVVQLENTRSLDVRSYITKGDGRFHFMFLSPDIDYTLRARYRRIWGRKKTLSQFNSRKNARITLTVDVKKEE